MEDFQGSESVVDAQVDAGQQEYSQGEQQAADGHAEGSETVVNTAVDAPKPDNVGEAIKREVARREEQLRKQYEEQYKPYTQHSEHLKKAARLNGWGDDVDGFVNRLTELEQQQQIEREAQRMGLDPDTYAQFFQPVTQELTQTKQELQAIKQQMTERQLQEQAQQQWGELYKTYPNLVESSAAFNEGKNPDWFTPQMQELVNMGYQPIHAYELAHKETLFRQKEQEVLARVTGRDERQVLPSTDQPNNVQLDPANMSFEQIQAISERVRRGERITL